MPGTKPTKKPYAGNRYVLTSKECKQLQNQIQALAFMQKAQADVLAILLQRLPADVTADPSAIVITNQLPTGAPEKIIAQ